MVLSFGEVPDDEQPPERIWLDDEALVSHWERVEEARAARYGGKSSGTEPVPQAAPMQQNELTAGFKR